MDGFKARSYLNIVANVPEPAEWVAVFGGIALVMAIYRAANTDFSLHCKVRISAGFFVFPRNSFCLRLSEYNA